MENCLLEYIKVKVKIKINKLLESKFLECLHF